jgi:hypothetical protein
MNERIKELATQATMIKGVNCEGYLGRSYTRQEEYFDKEKFAELIVEECIAQCEKNAEHEWLGSGSKLSAFNIKQHFGVEE